MAKKTDEKMEAIKSEMVEKILSDLEEKGPNWVQEWIDVPSMPFNPVAGTVYRGGNALLLLFMMAKNDLSDPRFITFNQAKANGYHVRKGSHAYQIEKWMDFWFLVDDPKIKIQQPRNREEREAYLHDDRYGFRWTVVGHHNLFNAADIEGIPAMNIPHNDMGEDGDAMLDYLENYSPCKVTEAAQGRAFYSPSKDAITLPVRRQFNNAGAAARTLLHEIGHATGHPDRLNRPQKNAFGSDAYAHEELIAELCCMFTAVALSCKLPAIEDDSNSYWANHVAYIKSWLRDQGEGAANELLKSASEAARASKWLTDNCFPAQAANSENAEVVAA